MFRTCGEADSMRLVSHRGPPTARRTFLKWAGTVAGGLALGCARGEGDRGEEGEQASFLLDQPLASGGFEILTTESPVNQYNDRKVLDHAIVKFSSVNEWSSFHLHGASPEHQFLVRARHMGWYTEVELKLVLHDQLQRRLVMRNRNDLMIQRLWLSRGYYHGDSARACFPVMTPRDHFERPFEGDLWFATLKPVVAAHRGLPNFKIDRETSRTFTYGQTPSGKVRLDLHDGFVYSVDWKSHPDGRGRDFRATWFRGTELRSETVESVYVIKEAVLAGCHAVRAAGYCDTDDV